MGLVYTNAVLVNVKDEARTFSDSFLVDTGATDTIVPSNELEQIGIERRRKRSYELADGTVVSYDVGVALVRFEDEETAIDVVFGKNGVEPLLGVTALQSTGFIVDPANHTLRKMSAIPLK
ncbi:MAG: clan AA aspartic protease [Defluviitaleaceae bacterium]|nr:clan AA aspartic protease [Defluviitaleaceae bacterium]